MWRPLDCKTEEKQAALLPPFPWETRGKNELMGMICLLFEENASYLFLSFLTSLIATSCAKDAMVNQNLPFCLATDSNIPRQPLDEPKSPPTQTWPSVGPCLPWGGISWLEILPVQPAVLVSIMWDKRNPRQETFISSNTTHNVMFMKTNSMHRLSCQTALMRDWSEDLTGEECRHEICAGECGLGLKQEETLSFWVKDE